MTTPHETTVTLGGTHSRRVLEHALWHVISASVIGERELSEAAFNEAWRAIHPRYTLDDRVAEAEFRLARIALIRRSLRVLATAAAGTLLRLPVSAAELETALLELLEGIDQNDELLAWLSEEDCRDVAACETAARRLLENLSPPAPTRVPDLEGPLTAARLVHAAPA
jgi:hypothetical protein